MKKAFTMIELVFVIVIMGIVASIGAEIIVKLYDNYLRTRSINKLQFQTELVLDQIAKRLTYRIKDSTVARVNNSGTYVPLADANSSYRILAWIGKNYEGFLGESNGSMVVPGWSGFVDLDSNKTNATQIKTSGSNLNYATDIINALSYGAVDLNGSDTGSSVIRPVIIFKGLSGYDVSKYGWNGGDGNYTLKVKYNTINPDILEFDENITVKGVTEISEQYDLAWSAYALVPEGSQDDFNLTLYYNFQPWYGNDYNSTIGIPLMEHVSTFRFRQIGETIRIKLCIRDDRTGGDYGFCKEKVVF